MNPDDKGWQSLRRCSRTLEQQTAMSTGGGRRGRSPTAVVHPFSSGEGEAESREMAGMASHELHSTQYSTTNNPSPYLLRTQPPVTSTVSHDLLRSPPSITLNLGHPAQCSSESHSLEMDHLRQQVELIQNRLAGDVTGSQEYQKLLSEKSYLEATLGATEYSLQQLSTAYNDLVKTSAVCEQEYSIKLKKAEDRTTKEMEEKKRAWEHLNKLQQYLSELPTTEEHQTLKDKLEGTTEEVGRLSAKVNHLASQLKLATAQEKEQAIETETLKQEKDDLIVKLNFTENILKEVESHREAAQEDGEQSMEELLWILDQTKKELDFAKKLVNYRKQKLEAVREEMSTQGEKLREEVTQREKLEDTVKDLETTIQQHKLMQDEVKSKLASTEEKLRKAEERLEAALGEVMSQQKISSTVAALMSAIQTAVNQLRDLVVISKQVSQGQTPDITVLLNFTDAQEEAHDTSLSLEAVSHYLKEVKSMKHQLDAVRMQLQEQYAQQLAKDVTCAQM